MNEVEKEALAAEYALGLTDLAETERCDAMAHADRDFASRVAGWRARFAELDLTAEVQAPSSGLWRRIEASTRNTRQMATPDARVSATNSSWSRVWQSLPVWRTAAFGAAAAATVIATIGIGLMRDIARTPVMVAVLLSDQRTPAAVVNAFSDGRTELVPLESLAAPEGKSLQVWTLWDRARGPVSVGLLEAMRSLELNVGGLPATSQDQLFEVTLEPAGGSPTGRPTGPILMKGNASRAL
ncbi:hypothetical protein G3545_02300 [Starkeya sp. ORNL1]|uniref:anti-sigma factor n=1 Tax=Starkeya sp. ORNL1 TaxID=2709380 RepID=UPI001463FB64|nr:anti-sigma factor [Starkeya sp. ORNL1]QJP12597.1 hypothetical protein G3545_02300 [Starkeya sp. ORNL1]